MANLTTITGTFTDGAGNALEGSVTFTPSDDLTDVADSAYYVATPVTVSLDATGHFSIQLMATDSPNLAPSGWSWTAAVSIGWSAPNSGASPGPGIVTGSFPFLLPSSPSTVDITALMPAGFSIISGESAGGVIIAPAVGYLPLTGGTETGTLILSGSPPLRVPSGATGGYVLTSLDGAGTVAWAAPSGGGGGSGVTAGAGLSQSGSVISLTIPVAGSNVSGQPVKRVTTLTVSSATYTPNCGTTDIALITTPSANFTVGNATGTPADGQTLQLRIKSGSTAYTPSWGASYSGSTAVPLPSACTVSATDYLGFTWNAAASKWHLVSYSPGY